MSELSGMGVETAERAWVGLWTTLHNPAPGIVAATPIVAFAPLGGWDCVEPVLYLDDDEVQEGEGLFESDPPALLITRAPQATIRWAAWSAHAGLLVGDAPWNEGTLPVPPTQWRRLEHPSMLLSHGYRMRTLPEHRGHETPMPMPSLPLPSGQEVEPGFDKVLPGLAIGVHRAFLDAIQPGMGANARAIKMGLEGQPRGWRGSVDMVGEYKIASYLCASDVLASSRSRHLALSVPVSVSVPGAGMGLFPGLPSSGLVEADQGAVDAAVASARLRRTQFSLAHPLFAGLGMERLREGIDQGLPSVPAIAARVGCSQRSVRALSRIPLERVEDGVEFMQSNWCVPLIDACPPAVLDILPAMSRQAWTGLTAMTRSLNYQYGVSHLGGYCNADNTRRGEAERYAHACMGARLQLVDGGLEWLADTGGLWVHASDMAEDFAKEILKPQVLLLEEARMQQGDYGGNSVSANAPLMLAMVAPRKLLRALAAHIDGDVHTARLAVEHMGVGRPDPLLVETGWGTASAPLDAPGGLHMRFLANQSQLDHEGRELGHCVAGYGQGCAHHASAILSIGRWAGMEANQHWVPSSTAELSLDSQGRLGVVQHRGQRNSRPPAANLAAMAWWMDELLAGRIALEPGSLVAGAQKMVRMFGRHGNAVDEIVERLGEGWRTPESHAWRWDRWRRLLDTRATTFAEWMQTLPPQALEANPSLGMIARRAGVVEAMMVNQQANRALEAQGLAVIEPPVPDGP